MRWTLPIKSLVACAIAALFFAGASHAAEPLVSMPLLAAAPYGWLDAKGQPQGLYPDVAVALAKMSGLAIRVEIVPFARAASLVANGAADATLMFSNAFTAGKVNEALTVFYATQVVQLRPGLHLAGRSGLATLRLGRINGGCKELSEDTRVAWNFKDLNTQESGVRMLDAGRLDGFCTNTEAVADAIGATGLQSRFEKTQVLSLASKPVWLMLSPKLAPETAKRLEAGVRQLQSSGELARIFKARLGSGYTLRTAP
ncbi:MAG: transporter substrate-binding domain-containing protein [Rhodoferax sp.]|nr:transporter substrate-binding domain-containing protein [Rhodoferax sp.]